MATGTRAILALKEAGIEFAVHAYETAELSDEHTYGESVARSLGVEAERLFKTLITQVDGEPTVAIVPVSGRLSPKLLARAAAGKKADLVEPALAERLTGYVTGGISPFGQKKGLPCFVDETIELWESVFVSAGRRGLQVELNPADLVRLLGATVSRLSG